MSFNYTDTPRSRGLVAKILSFCGIGRGDKPCLYRSRMDALDDPATRKALAGLSPHALRDIGVHQTAPSRPVAGDALRQHMW